MNLSCSKSHKETWLKPVVLAPSFCICFSAQQAPDSQVQRTEDEVTGRGSKLKGEVWEQEESK